uniref:ferredoxin-thioredoxin reductase, variable chain-like n=1 Tax=Erigeron canadensis TaxID=72917 RepID=UPI001CB999BC|nr:ferredoxin-thioredoxin reductase, variable chain-like [Erigeron canadensis]
MTSPALFSAAPAINPTHRLVSPTLFAYPCVHNPSFRYQNRLDTNMIQPLKSAASDSISIIDNPTSSEEESSVKVGAKVRVIVPLTVYHIPKVPEYDLNGKEGTIKENVAVWKGKQISANFPIKIEFLEGIESRGDKPVKFVAHLREDEFEYVD